MSRRKPTPPEAALVAALDDLAHLAALVAAARPTTSKNAKKPATSETFRAILVPIAVAMAEPGITVGEAISALLAETGLADEVPA